MAQLCLTLRSPALSALYPVIPRLRPGISLRTAERPSADLRDLALREKHMVVIIKRTTIQFFYIELIYMIIAIVK